MVTSGDAQILHKPISYFLSFNVPSRQLQLHTNVRHNTLHAGYGPADSLPQHTMSTINEHRDLYHRCRGHIAVVSKDTEREDA